jgi:hypothetical protein
MIKQIFAALAGLAIALPGQARVEQGTIPLIALLETGGIAVRYNSSDCESGEYLGLYRHRGMKRAMVLCPGATVDAEDHMVVRHEAIHAIQHCVNVARGTHIFTPIINDDAELMAFARKHLSDEYIESIKKHYDMNHWRIEFEAFAGMNAYTADEIAEMFTKACLYTDA